MEEDDNLATDLDSILNGSHSFENIEDNNGDASDDDAQNDTSDDDLNYDGTGDDDSGDDANIEDTDANSDDDSNVDTNDQDADLGDDTSDDSDDDSSKENAQEDDDSSNDDDANDDDSDNGSDDDSNDDSGTTKDDLDNSKDDDSVASASDDTDSGSSEEDNDSKIDYKAFYEKVANSEFKAKGKIVKGFTDPDKIIRAQQMLYDYEHKMSGIKEYRPLLSSLKESGMVENPDKFNMMMDIMNGDKEALKQFVKNNKIDPITDLDLDNISYSGKNYVDSKESLDVEDTIEAARNLGIEDVFKETVGKQWDNESFNEFTSKSQVREDLLTHMSTKMNPDDPDSSTIYETVQDKITEMKVLDSRGTFSSKSSIDQYREAVATINKEQKALFDSQPEKKKIVSKEPEEVAQSDVDTEKAKILAKRKKDQYEASLKAKKKQEDAEKRKKASAASKSKSKNTQKKEKFDPLKLHGNDFRDYFDSIGRG